MSDVSTEARVHALGNEGARLLTREPALAAAKFEEAHDLAIRIGMAVQSSSLSSLIARSWSLRGSLVQCIRFSRRAVREGPCVPGAYSTLGHFCEKAAVQDARAGKLRRALILFIAAARAYATAAEHQGDVDKAQTLQEIAKNLRQTAEETFVRYCNGMDGRDS